VTAEPRVGAAWPWKGEDGMNVKSACLVALVLILAGAGAARAQLLYGGPSGDQGGMGPSSPPPVGSGAREAGSMDGAVPPPVPRLSDYILGPRPADCCGPLGWNGPVAMDVYLRWGLNLPTDAGYFGRTLSTGWEVEGGFRSLFFSPAGDAAWVIDLGLSDITNHGQHSDNVALLHGVIVPGFFQPNLLTGAADLTMPVPAGTPGAVPAQTKVPTLGVSVRSLNRTYVNFGLGREWYLIGNGLTCGNGGFICGPNAGGPGCGGCCGCGQGWTWRVGCDVGGRWGTAKLELHELRHRTSVTEGVYLAVHSDVEIPCGCCIFVVGGRVEWDVTRIHILQDNDTDTQDVNLLMTMGVRF
jgi:hypothetical protein